MGDYVAGVDDLYAKYGEETVKQLIDLDGDGDPDTASVERAIADAEATVNSYLSTRYDLASLKAAKPPTVVAIALDLTVYELAKARDVRLVEPSSDYEALYLRAIKRLLEIAKGITTLDVDTVAEDPAVQLDCNDRVFTHETLKGF